MTQKASFEIGENEGARLNTLKPTPMTPVSGSGVDKGLKPGPMTPAPKPVPTQPTQPKKQ